MPYANAGGCSWENRHQRNTTVKTVSDWILGLLGTRSQEESCFTPNRLIPNKFHAYWFFLTGGCLTWKTVFSTTPNGCNHEKSLVLLDSAHLLRSSVIIGSSTSVLLYLRRAYLSSPNMIPVPTESAASRPAKVKIETSMLPVPLMTDS